MVVKPQTSARSRPGDLKSINDNHCVSNVVGLVNSVNVSDKMEGLNPPPPVTSKSETVFSHVDSFVASVPFASGSPQKKGVNPVYCQSISEINHVKDVSCVDHLSFVKIVTNVPTVVTNLPVGARLQQFWEKWETLGSSPKVIRILREGYTLPFRFRPNLTRSPMVISKYVNPQRQSLLLEALAQLTNKNAVEPVTNQTSLGFYNRLFLVPKPNNRWRPILDLSTLNIFLNTESFKMETPETIRSSLQVGEWVTSIDFKDAYFHIPIHSQSRKYMRFHIQGQSYQFKALPFCLSTAPMEFTVVAKEVKLMALQQGIRIHQYLDDWLVRASTLHTCLQHTQTLVTLCQELGWLVNKEKSELAPKQVFNFVGYQFDLKEGKVRPTDDYTARGTWSLPESKLHINHLELKAVFLALKEFRTLVCNKTVLIATDNTTVVAYINKEGGMKSGSLCALLWRILSWCTRQQVTLRARHIPGRLNVIADKLSRLGQTIQTEWSLHPAVFQAVCARWHQPKVDLFATRFNNKLPQTPRLGQWMHSVSPGRTWTHTPSHRQPSWAKWWRSSRTTPATE